MNNFNLHPMLVKDTLPITSLPLSDLVLMNNRLFPWCILVPRVPQTITEIYQLSATEQQQLLLESAQVAKILTALFEPDKLNIATIGNICPQLHMHHIVRYRNDSCWPNPVWGHGDKLAYSSKEATIVIEKLKKALIIDQN